jgi:hypothetical protein
MRHQQLMLVAPPPAGDRRGNAARKSEMNPLGLRYLTIERARAAAQGLCF